MARQPLARLKTRIENSNTESLGHASKTATSKGSGLTSWLLRMPTTRTREGYTAICKLGRRFAGKCWSPSGKKMSGGRSLLKHRGASALFVSTRLCSSNLPRSFELTMRSMRFESRICEISNVIGGRREYGKGDSRRVAQPHHHSEVLAAGQFAARCGRPVKEK